MLLVPTAVLALEERTSVRHHGRDSTLHRPPLAGADGGRRASGTAALTKAAFAEILLRRAWLGIVRGNHRASGVLPHPRRAVAVGTVHRRDRALRSPVFARRARRRQRDEDPDNSRRDANPRLRGMLRPNRRQQ